MDSRLNQIVEEAVKKDLENIPKAGQVWALRTDEIASLCITALKLNPPKRVTIKESTVGWHGKIVVALDESGQLWTFKSTFEVLYEIYRPSVWERLEGEDNHPENHEKGSETLVEGELLLAGENRD